MNLYFFYFFGSLLLLLLFINSKKISLIFKLYKKPGDNTPLTGGLGIYFFFLISVFYIYLHDERLFISNLNLIITASVIFLIGILDDILNVNYKIRLSSIFILIILFLQLDNKFLISQLYFETLDSTFILDKSSIFLTGFFILLLLNSLNMADGINGNSGIIFLTYLVLLYDDNNELNYFINFIFISLIIFLFFNLKNKLYMGDSGIYFISFLISLYTISSYNFGTSNLSSEKIFLIFMIPGIDMFRLFCLRIYNKKNPFKGDLNHLHHLLIKSFDLKYALIIYLLLIVWPNLINKIFDIDIFFLIFINLIIYFSIISNIMKFKIKNIFK